MAGTWETGISKGTEIVCKVDALSGVAAKSVKREIRWRGAKCSGALCGKSVVH